MNNEGDEKSRTGFSSVFRPCLVAGRSSWSFFVIWAIQAIPKWTAAIVGDGETSAAIMRMFVTPRA